MPQVDTAAINAHPVENIRACLGANQLAIPVFDTHEQIVDACCQA